MVSFEKFFVFDSTMCSLFPGEMKGVGRLRKDDGKKKGGLKIHMLTDVPAGTIVFAKINEIKMPDKKYLQHQNLVKYSLLNGQGKVYFLYAV